jgi:hypothetical protein
MERGSLILGKPHFSDMIQSTFFRRLRAPWIVGVVSAVAGFVMGCGLVRAGEYVQGFTVADGMTVLGDSSVLGGTPTGTVSVQGGSLRLSVDGVGASTGSYKLPVLDAGKEITEFTVSFQLRFDKGNPAVAPGEGFAMNFGALPTNNGRGEEGYAMTNGLTVGWDTADAVDGPYVRLKVGDTNVRTVLASALNPLGTSFNGVPNFFFDGAFHPVVIKWSVFDGVDVSYAGQVLMTGIPTPGFSPAVGHRFGFTARTSATSSRFTGS